MDGLTLLVEVEFAEVAEVYAGEGGAPQLGLIFADPVHGGIVDFPVMLALLLPACFLLLSPHPPLMISHRLCLIEEERFQVCTVLIIVIIFIYH